jgi:hypothetical protein
MGKQQEKAVANSTDKVFVFGLDDEGKPRGARFADFNDKIVQAAAEMHLTSVYPASAAFTEIAMKLPVGSMRAAKRSCRLSGATSSRSLNRCWPFPATKAKPIDPRPRQRKRLSRRRKGLKCARSLRSALDSPEAGTASMLVMSSWATPAQRKVGGNASW